MGGDTPFFAFQTEPFAIFQTEALAIMNNRAGCEGSSYQELPGKFHRLIQEKIFDINSDFEASSGKTFLALLLESSLRGEKRLSDEKKVIDSMIRMAIGAGADIKKALRQTGLDRVGLSEEDVSTGKVWGDMGDLSCLKKKEDLSGPGPLILFLVFLVIFIGLLVLGAMFQNGFFGDPTEYIEPYVSESGKQIDGHMSILGPGQVAAGLLIFGSSGTLVLLGALVWTIFDTFKHKQKVEEIKLRFKKNPLSKLGPAEELSIAPPAVQISENGDVPVGRPGNPLNPADDRSDDAVVEKPEEETAPLLPSTRPSLE